MGAADTDGLGITLHQLAQQNAALNRGNPQLVCFNSLRVVTGSRAGVDH